MSARYATLLVALLTLAPAAHGGDMGKSPADVTLLPGWRMENGHHMAALRVTLSDGWKTYWRAPGDGGIPPDIDWSDSINLAGVEFHWPVPEVMAQSGLQTIGYHHEVVLPLELTPSRAGDPIRIDAELLIGICKDICVPYEARLDATLDPDTAQTDARILRALELRPETGGEAGLSAALCSATALSDGVRVSLRLDLPPLGPDEVVVVEAANPTIWVSEAMAHRAADGMLVAEADLVPPDARPFELRGEDLRLTVLGAGRAVDIHGCELTSD